MSVLQKLENDSIFSIEVTQDNLFIIQERCDGYYDSTLTPAELRQLGEELIALASKHDTGTLAPTT